MEDTKTNRNEVRGIGAAIRYFFPVRQTVIHISNSFLYTVIFNGKT